MSLEQIDQNLTTLRHIDGTWQMPPLPEQVMLDLAILPGIQSQNLESLLYGAAGEMETASSALLDDWSPATTPPTTTPPTTTMPPVVDPQRLDFPGMDPGQVAAPGHEPTNRFLTRWFSAIQGGDRPHEIPGNALLDWKQRAIQGGYIEMDDEEFASSLWRPEYNTINSLMVSDRMRRDFQGGEEGALSVQETANLFDDWLSPPGLARAMIEADLGWDYDQIAQEFVDWDDKARKFWRDLNATWGEDELEHWYDPVASFVDMVTGPIDDAVVPGLNWFLLATGVGNVFLSVKGLTMGAQAANASRIATGFEAARRARGLGPLAKAVIPAKRFETGVGGMTGAAGTRLTNFGKPSGISSYLVGGVGGQYTGNVVGRGAAAAGQALPGIGMRGTSTLGQQAIWAGSKMQAWRNLRGVQAGKVGFQQLWKTGLGIRTADALRVGEDRGEGTGLKLENVGIVAELRDQYLYPSSMSNIAGDIVFDLMFTPYTIYEPGTIKSIIRGAGMIKNRALHASALVLPPVKRHLAAKGHRGSRALATFHESTLDYLRRHDPDLAIEYEQVARTESPGAALSRVFFNGSEDDFGAAYVHALYSIGIEHAARQTANVMAGVDENFARNPVYGTIKHWLEGQSRYLDPHDMRGNLAEIAAQARMGSVKHGGTFASDEAAVAHELSRLVDEFLETPAEAASRAGKTGDGYARLIREADPNSLDYSWYRTLRRGEIPDADAQVLDLNLEEYAAFHGRSVDDIKDFFNNPEFKHYIPPAMEGFHRVFDFGDIQAGTARRWDLEKSKWMWDPEILGDAAGDRAGTLRGVVHNHNAKRDGTIAEIINNLESGNPNLSSEMHGLIPHLGQIANRPMRGARGYTETVPALQRALTDDFLDRFSHWNEYVAAADQLGEEIARGGLDSAQYLKALSDPKARRLSLYPFARDDPERPRPYAGHLFGEGAGDYSYIEWINKGMYAPLVRALDQSKGRYHLARLGTVTKQEAIEFAAQVNYRYGMLRTLRKMKTMGVFGAVDEATDQLLKSDKTLTPKIIKDYLDQILATEKQTGERVLARAFGGKERGKFAQIVEAMAELGDDNALSLQRLEEHLIEDLTHWANSPEWVARFGLKDMTDAGHDMVEVARKRARQLQEESKWIAAEIDPLSFEGAGGAAFVQSLADKGYKVVHGVEFTDPRMLGNLIPELGLHQAHVTSKLTLGLSRQNPYWLSHLRMRTTKSTIAGALAAHAARLPDPTPATYSAAIPGVKGRIGTTSKRITAGAGIRGEWADGDPNSNGVQQLIDKLWKIVREVNMENQAALDRVELGLETALGTKFGVRLKASRTPYSVPDLASLPYKQMKAQIMELGLSEDEFHAVWEGLKKARKIQGGMWVRGLAHLEDHLRSRPTLLDATMTLGKHRAGDFMRDEGDGLKGMLTLFRTLPENMKRFATESGYRRGWSKTYGGRAGTWMGTWVPATAATSMASEEDPNAWGFDVGGHRVTPKWGVGAGLPAAFMGNAASKLLARRLLGLAPEMSRWASVGQTASGVSADVSRIRSKSKVGQAWEAMPFRNPQALFSHTDWQKYAYMGDHYVNMRDYLRFSLSPIFDMSRYAEAMTLSQVVGADVAAGMKLNQSPSAFRKALAKGYRERGFDAQSAATEATAEWMRVRSSFMAQAKGRGDFDWENIENMSRWFTSVGIFGFSPQSWMASTYGQMLQAGVRPDDAYDAARSIYTYGLTGRSAAEQSVNMVFFPFSFMKKTVGHFSKYMMEDYSRAVILHDMMKTVEVMDEKYDLQRKYEAYLPILGKMRRLNLFAYGLSLGEFGGPNAPFLRFLHHLPFVGQAGEAAVGGMIGMIPGAGADKVADEFMVNPVVSALMPNAVSIKDADDASSLEYNVKRMFPLWNDFQHMAGDFYEQAEVLASPHHVSKREQNRRAWEEWDIAKTWARDQLHASDLPYTAINRQGEDFEKLNAWLQGVEADLLVKYPSWGAEKVGGAGGGVAIANELAVRLDPNTGVEDVDRTAVQPFAAWLTAERQAVSESGWYLTDVDFMPPEFHANVRDAALYYVGVDQDFLGIYNRIWAREYGPISTEIR